MRFVSSLEPGNTTGCIVWLTGLSAAGKTTLATELAGALARLGVRDKVLDGDQLRATICRDLGFSRADREENVRRIYQLAVEEALLGVVVIVAAIAPYRSLRDQLRDNSPVPFFEVFVDAPISVCEQRDPKGLYRRARSGELKGLTGIDDPYEAPQSPDAHCRTDLESVEESCARVLRLLEPYALAAEASASKLASRSASNSS
jgi:adenylyl-sulfate kinase